MRRNHCRMSRMNHAMCATCSSVTITSAHAVAIEHAVYKEIESHQDRERYNRVDCEHLQRSLLGKHCNRERNHRHNVHVVVEHHGRCIAERYVSKRTSTRLYGGPHMYNFNQTLKSATTCQMLPNEGDRVCIYWSSQQLNGALGHWFSGIAKKRGALTESVA